MSRRRFAQSRAGGPGRAGLEQRLLQRARRLALPPEAHIIVGFSGGPDSLALAGALARIAPLTRLSITAVHVDHGLRPESADEQAQAAALAAQLGLGFRGERIPPGAVARHTGVGIEEAARRERFLALAHVANNRDAAVALAHHASDQAETVLLHLLRGAGLAGAAGMAELTDIAVPWWNDPCSASPRKVRVWRPFLSESRQTVRAYADTLGLAPIEDPSNADRAFRRNAIRAGVLPTLEGVQPGATAALARYARLAADDDALLEELARRALAAGGTAGGGLERCVLLAEATALRRRMVRQWIAASTGFRELTADRVEAIIALAERDTGRHLEIGAGWRVELSDHCLRIFRALNEAEDRATEILPGQALGERDVCG